MNDKLASVRAVIPASVLYDKGRGGWEYDLPGFANWPKFLRSPKREQVEWAKEYVGSGIREPVDVSVFADGKLDFQDGHHRVLAGALLGIDIPIRVKFINFDPNLWPDLLRILEAGYSFSQYNPQGWSLKESGVPPLDVVRRGPNAADRWITTTERVMRSASSRVSFEDDGLRNAFESLTASSVKTALRVRQLHKMMEAGKEFGVLSAYGSGKSKSENQSRHRELLMSLQSLGYRKVHPLRGKWEGVAEKSVMVPSMKFRDLVELGNQFEQDSVIFKSRDGVIGMYYLKRPVATLAVDLDSMSPDVQISDQTDLYSKSRGVSFEFNFMWEREIPWGGRRPFRIRDVENMMETGSLAG